MRSNVQARRHHQSWIIVRVLLATLVGLSIVALAAGNTERREVNSPGEFGQPRQRTVETARQRVGRELESSSPIAPAESKIASPSDEAATQSHRDTRPSRFDIWTDDRAMAFVSRAA